MNRKEYEALKAAREEFLREAKEHPNLPYALGTLGIKLVRVGRTRSAGEAYVAAAGRGRKGRGGDFSSLTFIHNPDDSWVVLDYKQRNGRLAYNAINALTDLFGVRFQDAVRLLNPRGEIPEYIAGKFAAPKEDVERPSLVLPKKEKESRHVFGYLVKTRGIDPSLVGDLLRQGKIYEGRLAERGGREIPVAVFPYKNEKDETVGADCRSAYSSVPIKKSARGSDASYGWCFTVGDAPPSGGRVYYCEGAIDAMSLYCLTRENGTYVSLAEVKDITFERMNAMLGGTPVICTDNDEAGNLFRRKHAQYETLIPTTGKDWNDVLKAIRVQETTTPAPTAALKEELPSPALAEVAPPSPRRGVAV